MDETMWREREELIGLARQAIREARRELEVQADNQSRLKTLPNIDINMDRLLWRAGIRNIYDLRFNGDKRSYRMRVALILGVMRSESSEVTFAILFTLTAKSRPASCRSFHA
ncbi:TfoX/Sxy family DNA transformation protein [Serratia liquefaciens]|uniref:TfoX/Sxy family DNA transformation protein n=1 Tax=Serratia liquefaciens TaxID=614 RepID=UPI0037F7ED71